MCAICFHGKEFAKTSLYHLPYFCSNADLGRQWHNNALTDIRMITPFVNCKLQCFIYLKTYYYWPTFSLVYSKMQMVILFTYL